MVINVDLDKRKSGLFNRIVKYHLFYNIAAKLKEFSQIGFEGVIPVRDVNGNVVPLFIQFNPQATYLEVRVTPEPVYNYDLSDYPLLNYLVQSEQIVLDNLLLANNFAAFLNLLKEAYQAIEDNLDSIEPENWSLDQKIKLTEFKVFLDELFDMLLVHYDIDLRGCTEEDIVKFIEKNSLPLDSIPDKNRVFEIYNIDNIRQLSVKKETKGREGN